VVAATADAVVEVGVGVHVGMMRMMMEKVVLVLATKASCSSGVNGGC
jgi:uncharacterized UPF0146 family protein